MLKRIITAIIGVPIIVWILISESGYLTAAVAAAAVLAMYEFYRAIGLWEKNRLLCIIGIIGGCVICLGRLVSINYFMLIAFIYVLMLFIALLHAHKRILLTDIALIILGNIFIAYFIMHIVLVRNMSAANTEVIDIMGDESHKKIGQLYVWMVFIGAFITDSCAYFTGKFGGKTKLCPGISPKKTVEGAIGGVVGCGLAFLLYGWIIQNFFSQYLFGRNINFLLIFLMGILCAIISEIGDLIASIIKRQYNIKDYGTLLPGHGGIMDRCDSLLFVAPVVYLFLLHVGILI